MPTVHLIDASPYIFRAYFALPETITDRAGRPSHAVYGFASFLLKYLEDEDVTHAAAAFDASLTSSFRNEIYPEYKAQRELPPPELEAQQRACRDVAAALGLTTWVDDRYESDDLIATACAQLDGDDVRAVVVSSDKDLAQLVSDRVQLHDPARSRRMGPDDVVAKLGVRPAQVADLLALAGDAVDNIPGVRGVGAKSAAALLAAFDDVEAIYARLDAVADLPVRGAAALARKLAEQEHEARLSLALARLADDAPIRPTLDALRLLGADDARITPLFEEFGLTALRERIRRWA